MTQVNSHNNSRYRLVVGFYPPSPCPCPKTKIGSSALSLSLHSPGLPTESRAAVAAKMAGRPREEASHDRGVLAGGPFDARHRLWWYYTYISIYIYLREIWGIPIQVVACCVLCVALFRGTYLENPIKVVAVWVLKVVRGSSLGSYLRNKNTLRNLSILKAGVSLKK